MNSTPFLVVDHLCKTYTQGTLKKRVTFQLEANFTIEEPAIVGMMGPNGSGKTTLFELITGSNIPTSGTVTCLGKNIHKIKYHERDRLAIHYHQSYQVRKFKRTIPNFLLESAESSYPKIHLFDEPQFNTQDGYIGFMLDFFRKLRREGRLVFLCVHPNELFHLEIMQEICERYMFVHQGTVTEYPNFETLLTDKRVKDYLGQLVESVP
ncbi:ATP-binding cassette domain-containing protein [candidate division WOR-3 bacterium]|uniref:ATP-binding cassette domain-containing protein n=1 Tax=candidate division WOR-3 bacterium TaxID=2052148 RepID=A0A9D5KAV4_UNCW3|nr:ATP-binding cassette domain-containing protein [candidate division WOR-3 bacterium]